MYFLVLDSARPVDGDDVKPIPLRPGFQRTRVFTRQSRVFEHRQVGE